MSSDGGITVILFKRKINLTIKFRPKTLSEIMAGEDIYINKNL